MTVKVSGKCTKCGKYTEIIASDAEEGPTLLYNEHGVNEKCVFKGEIHIDDMPVPRPVFTFEEPSEGNGNGKNGNGKNGNGNGKKRR